MLLLRGTAGSALDGICEGECARVLPGVRNMNRERPPPMQYGYFPMSEWVAQAEHRSGRCSCLL